MQIKALYNSRKPNGDVSDMVCDACGKIGGAYINISNDDFGEINQHTVDINVCKGCLSDWDKLINKSILKDVMDSVERRRRKENV